MKKIVYPLIIHSAVLAIFFYYEVIIEGESGFFKDWLIGSLALIAWFLPAIVSLIILYLTAFKFKKKSRYLIIFTSITTLIIDILAIIPYFMMIAYSYGADPGANLSYKTEIPFFIILYFIVYSLALIITVGLSSLFVKRGR